MVSRLSAVEIPVFMMYSSNVDGKRAKIASWYSRVLPAFRVQSFFSRLSDTSPGVRQSRAPWKCLPGQRAIAHWHKDGIPFRQHRLFRRNQWRKTYEVRHEWIRQTCFCCTVCRGVMQNKKDRMHLRGLWYSKVEVQTAKAKKQKRLASDDNTLYGLHGWMWVGLR